MMTIDEMRIIKKAKGYTNAQISELSGVPLGTVQKVFAGETEHPRYATIQALEKMFKDIMGIDSLKEEAYYQVPKIQGEYTLEDYYALPNDKRVELIDGVFYDMSAPAFDHQIIAGEVYRQIANFIYANKGNCIPMMSPIDVRLDCDDKTMVQPDVLILCDKSKKRCWGIMGAPDFVLEVLSPSTKNKDCLKKLEKYVSAGVKEYWMIDPENQKLIVYRFEQEVYPAIYGLEGKVDIGIYEGKLQINLDLVREMIEEI